MAARRIHRRMAENLPDGRGARKPARPRAFRIEFTEKCLTESPWRNTIGSTAGGAARLRWALPGPLEPEVDNPTGGKRIAAVWLIQARLPFPAYAQAYAGFFMDICPRGKNEGSFVR